MKTERIFTMFIAGFVVLAVAYLFVKNSGDSIGLSSEAQAKETRQQVETRNFDTKSTGGTGSGDALVELTPRIKDGNKLLVHFSANTHSVRLGNFDLTKITTLEYEGKILKPVKAGKLGGHHSTSVIVFDVGKEVRNFKIKLYGIPNIQERVYEWNG
ncbi:MAG: hypothetical protein ABFR82_10625 [Nitrospirota bacterium]